jgi:hypothetical protein
MRSAARNVRALGWVSLAASGWLWACTNNPTPPSPGSTPQGSAPKLTALPASGDPMADGALDLPLWTGTEWTPLRSAMNESRRVSATKVASLYDADKLYIAFVGVDGTAAASTSVWLDTSVAQNGTEVFEIDADAKAGVRGQIWHRCVVPPEAQEKPDYAWPMTHNPGFKVSGLTVRTGRTTMEGQPAWTVVYAIPVKALPAPLAARMKPGETIWRVNCLRQDVGVGASGAREVVQSNLSPVVAGAQAMMPYRMTSLVLATGNKGTVAATGK